MDVESYKMLSSGAQYGAVVLAILAAISGYVSWWADKQAGSLQEAAQAVESSEQEQKTSDRYSRQEEKINRTQKQAHDAGVVAREAEKLARPRSLSARQE